MERIQNIKRDNSAVITAKNIQKDVYYITLYIIFDCMNLFYFIYVYLLHTSSHACLFNLCNLYHTTLRRNTAPYPSFYYFSTLFITFVHSLLVYTLPFLKNPFIDQINLLTPLFLSLSSSVKMSYIQRQQAAVAA